MDPCWPAAEGELDFKDGVCLRYQVNLKAHHVEYNHFYIPDITSLVDIQEDYLKWFLSKAQIVSMKGYVVFFWSLFGLTCV